MMASEIKRIKRALIILGRINEMRRRPAEVRASLFVEEVAIEDELDNIDGEGNFNRKDTEWHFQGRPGPLQLRERCR